MKCQTWDEDVNGTILDHRKPGLDTTCLHGDPCVSRQLHSEQIATLTLRLKLQYVVVFPLSVSSNTVWTGRTLDFFCRHQGIWRGRVRGARFRWRKRGTCCPVEGMSRFAGRRKWIYEWCWSNSSLVVNLTTEQRSGYFMWGCKGLWSKCKPSYTVAGIEHAEGANTLFSDRK